VKVKIAGSCTLYVYGLDMNCPMCGTLVKSGENHACQKQEPKQIEAGKKLRARPSEWKEKA